MSPRPIRNAILLAAAAAGLAACSSYGDRGYGYSRVSLGVGSASPYYGWYDGYYYPGTGYYLYDRQGTRHRWRDSDRRYWERRRGHAHARDNWSGYHYRRQGDRDYRHDDRRYRHDDRDHRRDEHRYDRSNSHRGHDRDDRSRGHRNHDRNEWRRGQNGRD